jgi:hypothetical protein
VAKAAWMDTEFMKHLMNLANAVDGSIQAGAKSVLELLWQDAEMMKHLTKLANNADDQDQAKSVLKILFDHDGEDLLSRTEKEHDRLGRLEGNEALKFVRELHSRIIPRRRMNRVGDQARDTSEACHFQHQQALCIDI